MVWFGFTNLPIGVKVYYVGSLRVRFPLRNNVNDILKGQCDIFIVYFSFFII